MKKIKEYENFENEASKPDDWDYSPNIWAPPSGHGVDWNKSWDEQLSDIRKESDEFNKQKDKKMDKDDLEKMMKGEIKDKEKKVFKVGDEIKCINNKQSKSLPQDAYEYILTFKKFTVIEVNDHLNIDIGHKLANGNVYYFSPNRFELIDGTAPTKKIERTPEEIKKLEMLKKKKKEKDPYAKYKSSGESDWSAPYSPRSC